MFKLVFYVPEENAEAVKDSVFAVGAGRYELYDSCAYQTRGTGQFRPLPGSDPHIGERGRVEHVEELRVELVCREAVVRAAVAALLDAHPYEEPAYEVYRIWTAADLPVD